MNFIVHLTNRCNLNCIYCFEGKRIRRSQCIFSVEEMRRLYEAILAYQRKIKKRRIGFQFTGGEPLTINAGKWRRFFELQKEIFPKSYKIESSIQTNLYRLTPAMIKVIRDYNVAIGVSCDFSPVTRPDLAGNDSSQRVMRNMQRLWDNGIEFGIISVASSYNIDQLEDIYDFMEENGIGFHFIPLNRVAFAPQRKHLIKPQEYADHLYKVIEKYILNADSTISFRNALDYSHLLLKSYYPRFMCSFDRRCTKGFVAVKASGDVFACPACAYDELKLGNYHEQSFADILKDSNPIIKMFKDRFRNPGKYNLGCKTCRWLRICNQGCPYDSIQQGNFYKKSEFRCKVNKMLFPKLTKLFKEVGLSRKLRR